MQSSSLYLFFSTIASRFSSSSSSSPPALACPSSFIVSHSSYVLLASASPLQLRPLVKPLCDHSQTQAMLCVSCSHPRIMPTRAIPTMTPKTSTLLLPNLTSPLFHPNLRTPSPSLAYPLSLYRTEGLSSGTLVPVSPISHSYPFHIPSFLLGSHRSYTPIKTLGDGSFGTVLLCDWHGTLPPNTPLSPMQCGGGARPEWAGKRLVAVKRMRRKWEGGWDECKRLKELEVRPSTFRLNSLLTIFLVITCNPVSPLHHSAL